MARKSAREFGQHMDTHLDQPPALKSARSYEEQDRWIVDAMRDVARQTGQPLRILEAGCGNRWPLDMGDTAYHLTGLDLDAAALELRLKVRRDLDVAIHGDLCTAVLPKAAFDIVYSGYVLEHIREADLALENMVGALRSGGLLILRIPDPDTARALVTRNTPLAFHVFYYRHVMGRPLAGTPGHAPYETFYHPIISKVGMQRFAVLHALRWRGLFADEFVRDGKGMLGFCFRAGARLVSAASFGRFTNRYNDLVYLFEKP